MKTSHHEIKKKIWICFGKISNIYCEDLSNTVKNSQYGMFDVRFEGNSVITYPCMVIILMLHKRIVWALMKLHIPQVCCFETITFIRADVNQEFFSMFQKILLYYQFIMWTCVHVHTKCII